MTRFRKVLAGLVGVAAAAALALTPSAFAAAPGGGAGGGGAGGGGGGGGGGETTVANNLSVPAVFIGAEGFGLTNPALQMPTGSPSTGYEIDPSAYYFVQGQNKWQAQFVVQSTDTATAKWGDNLSGSASLKAGHPVRVEMGLTSTTVIDLRGYSVVKLQPSLLDRNSAYGTLATPDGTGSYTAAATEMPARVWVAGASVTITGPSGTVVAAMPGEINATGAIVFGYNWRPSVPGIYQLMFHVPEGTVTFANPADTVKSVTVTAGGGGRR